MSPSALPRLESFLDSALPGSADVTLTPLAGDGSTRRFYRFRHGGRRWVLSQSSATVAATPREHRWERVVHDFLRARGVDVPHRVAADPEAGFLLMEDLGDTHLCDLVAARERRDDDAIERHYQHAIDYIVRVQTAPAPPQESEPQAAGTSGAAEAARAAGAAGPHPEYDREFIVRHEAGYFFQELACGVYHAETAWDAIKQECGRLAESALAGVDHRVLIHRDYQSRNLMLADSDRMVVIDYQGARPGPPEYDLASLLFDPYTDLSPALRNRLVLFYWDRMHEETSESASLDQLQAAEYAWRVRFRANAANRLMQALGAFAKLGCRMERPGFREHIPTGLRLLEEVLAVEDDTPALLDLVRSLRRLRPPAV